ncbi:MAG TPA: gephyrin-like molybdotransferase Glp [Hypericibacter adhaerens]|jgi:molybdopterin molybdotransferase|uniref:molybdopterin molybdotransferase MoeA n=1 Tax=Hypericibacter adhaerens TaxID=2602016 RepID=UPI002B62AE2A|nr:gephyrin-like molybdotransferase Glp [Hypericibacter adhaerens]HWA46372.1 gephyrin-like molybdotransferase Glp [Hypericibacter adhaerens]
MSQPLDRDCFSGSEPLMTLGAALALLCARIRPVVGIERLPLEAALGRILAADIVAGFDVPGHDNAAVDGYAVYGEDLNPTGETRLPIAGRAAAGHPLAGLQARGTAVRIFTGAMMPAGLQAAPGPDTVAMQEECRIEEGTVVIPAGLERGRNRRRRGEDIRAGRKILEAGQRLRPQEIGLAAAAGQAVLPLRARLRVALFSTGDELAEPGQPLGAGTIHDSNRYVLGALLRQSGAAVGDLGILPDRPDAVRLALQVAARDHDLLLTSGGVSSGEEDHVKAALLSMGRLHVWRLAIKPGRPVALGQIDAADRAVPFIGLPGNPVAAMVTYLRIARPLILGLMGAKDLEPVRYRLPAAFALRKKRDRREFLRGWVETDGNGRQRLQRFEQESSAILTSMTAAAGLIEIAEDVTEVAPGDLLDFLPFAEMR